jgi:uncharacterized repeat protein (TIGR03803 family)
MRTVFRIGYRSIRLAPLVAVLAAARPSAAMTVTTVHAFTGTDGSHPMAGLFLGADGKFYGTTSQGGTGVTDPAGTVFRVAPNGDFTSLYTFNFQVTGDEPFGGVVADGSGNLYGTTRGSGAYLGNVFKLGANFTDLHGFAGYFFGPDGSHPESAPVLATDGNLYGVTSDGGNNNIGSAYRVTTSDGTYAMIHSFNGEGVPADGNAPRGALVNGSDGNLYGTTAGGGPSGAHGTVFEMTTAGVVTTLHTFVGTDGDTPLGTLVLASDGNFYGTTSAGGAHSLGTVFRISPSGDFTSLYSFDSSTGEGYSPSAGLVQASDGYLYGTAPSGGENGLGAVFRMSVTGTPETIYSFAFDGAEGYTPRGALVEDTDGNLYGTTNGGGNACSCGAVFKLVPSVPTTSTTTAPSSTTSSTQASVTTSSTTSSTHASVTTTSSTSTTVLASTTTAPVTTSTAVELPLPTTTTTLPAGGCAGTPQGATFASILCRLDALAARVQGESGLGSFQSKLAKSLDTARSRTEDAQSLCDAGAKNAKKTKKRLQDAGKAVSQYVHRLAGLPARNKLDGTLRTEFLQAGQAIEPDLSSLRAHVQCPPA